ncbi:UDP-glucuronic acid decarboxylase family protein [Meiothermus rufus]|uniref:UDP-glucuronic acid decarboxylase family protein n=1 Tax=Meiothermus rufus TaxID=604332 RepID=UPI0003F63268|nr:UDP-glucuronic acid decarboxylase family protein [Meiothermus rufus]
MRILITGAAGFLGSHLAERLLLEGHEIIGVDNFSSGQRRNIELLSEWPRFHFLEADASRPLDIAGPLDWVMHFASPASPPRYLKLPLETLLVNAEGTRHLLDLAVAKGARFFLASTSEVYGDPLVHPQPEGYWGNVNPVGPRAIYDEAKRYAETLTTAYQQARGVSTRIIRIFNTYGPRMDPQDGRVVTNFIVQALKGQPLTIFGDGCQTRSFQYVDDLIEGIRRLMEVEYHQPVNLGNPEEYTMLELAQLVQELVGSRLPFVHQPLPQDDPRQRRPDITRAKTLLGWEPRVPVREGLARTIAYFRELLYTSPEVSS